MITNKNQACFTKKSGCGLQEGKVEKRGANNTYKSSPLVNVRLRRLLVESMDSIRKSYPNSSERLNTENRQPKSKPLSLLLKKKAQLKLPGLCFCFVLNLTGHQATISLVLVSLMATFTASSIGSLKGTSIRSRPFS